MARQKKHPKLPNGYGSIKKLSGKNRTNPYGVYPPTTEFAPNGSPITPKAIAYVADWYKGFYVLMAYKNGTLTDETLQELQFKDTEKEFDIVSKIIAAYNNSTHRSIENSPTFERIYEEYYDYKYNRDKSKEYSKASKYSTKAAFSNCSALHKIPFRSLNTGDLQKVIDECTLKYSSKELILNLYHQMYAYADMMNLCDKDYSVHVKINDFDDDEKGIPFTEKEIDLLWKHKDENEIYLAALIMIYSGYRVSAYHTLFIDMEEGYFKGGVKNRSSKNRIVPIHPLIKDFVNQDLKLFAMQGKSFRPHFAPALAQIGITGHTPHDCRHTFSWLCDKYNMDPFTKKLLLGHSHGTDITKSRYGHRTFDELKTEIEKIKHW